jgi:cytochrome c peroxidase
MDRLAVRIKVPLGLPDPTPNIPPANRPTYLQWRLGKKLFFDKELLPGPSPHVRRGCVTCHSPKHGFTVDRDRVDRAALNPPTLINSVYNRHQFWDGRATHLEEVLQRSLDDEAGPAKESPLWERPEVRHAWPGVVQRLREQPEYRREFERVYAGAPSLGNVGRALAAYLRTILSGDSVYDRAEAARARAGAKDLAAAHFEAGLDDAALKALGSDVTRQETARELLLGHTLFYGKARCATCHPGPLFTDHGFHNLGRGDSDSVHNRRPGEEKGRFAALPAGLKDPRYLGAFRTATLRALPRTAPYMHDGGLKTLDAVVNYFNSQVWAEGNPFLDPELRDSHRPRRLGLARSELRAVELFLKSLDGGPVARLVADAPPK